VVIPRLCADRRWAAAAEDPSAESVATFAIVLGVALMPVVVGFVVLTVQILRSAVSPATTALRDGFGHPRQLASAFPVDTSHGQRPRAAAGASGRWSSI
jgi:hypothetical protein